MQVGIEDLPENEKLTIYASGNYSVTGFYVTLERKVLNLVLQFILPSAMFVVVSWISFFMPLNGGERAGLLVTLFLVLVTMFLQVVTTAPKGTTRVKSKLDMVRLTQKFGHNSSLHRWRLRLTQKFGQNSSLHRFASLKMSKFLCQTK